MSIKNFKELNAWQESIKLSKGIYILTKKFPTEEKYNLIKHLKESSRGTAANIAEGFGRYYYREKLQFYGIARGCLNEVLSDIELSCLNNFITKDEYERCLNQIEKVAKMLNKLITNTNKKLKGEK